MEISIFENFDDEELYALSLCRYQPTPILQKIKSFDFNLWNDDFCYHHFRFYKNDLFRLKRALSIPNTVILDNKIKISGLESLCILLKRLAYPNRYVDMMKIFPRSCTVLSRVFNTMVRRVHENHAYLLANLKHQYITQDVMQDFAEAVYNKGAPYRRCIGFLDGTVRPICRPSKNQKEFYNGHKRTHAIKFQGVMLPNGIIGALHGPVSGRRHDAYILHESGIIQQMHDNFVNNNGDPFYLYGDPAYPLKSNLIVPFRGANLCRTRQICNKRMSAVRESVEWGFGKVVNLFSYLDYKKNLKIGSQPVSKYYKVGVLLTNCHTTLYGSQTSDYFDCNAPTLEEYLNIL